MPEEQELQTDVEVSAMPQEAAEIPQKPRQTANITADMIQQKIDQARQAPNSPLAKQIRQRLDTGAYDAQLTELGLKRGVNGLERIGEPTKADIAAATEETVAEGELPTEEIAVRAEEIAKEERPGVVGRAMQVVRETPALRPFVERIEDVIQRFRGTGEEVVEAGRGVVEEVGELARGEQSVRSTLLQSAGELAKAGTGIIDEQTLGKIREFLPQEDEDLIAQSVQNTANRFVQSDFFNTVRSAAQDVAQKTGLAQAVEALPEEQKENLAAIGNIAALGLEFTGAGAGARGARAAGQAGARAAGRVAATGRVARETTEQFAKAAAERTARQTKALKEIAEEVTPKSKDIRDKQIIRALDISQGDLRKIEQNTGNEIGDFIARNNLIGNTPQETIDKVVAFKNAQRDAVDEAISRVTRDIAKDEIDSADKMLTSMLAHVDNVPGLEAEAQAVRNLLAKDTYQLSDLQEAKRLFDDVENVFSKSGEVKTAFNKRGLANLRRDVKEFIEKEVKAVDPEANIAQLNNDVATSEGIRRISTIADNRFMTRNAASLGDFFTFGAVAGAAGLTGGAAIPIGIAAVVGKKILESGPVRLRVARLLKKFDDAKAARLANEIDTGSFSDEARDIVEQAVQEASQANR